MTPNPTVDILNMLLAAEQSSAIERLRESTVFVSWASADEYPIVKRIARETNEHCAWLVDLIDRNHGYVRPRAGDLRTADMHFQELDYLLPRVIEHERSTLKKYEAAAAKLANQPEAAAVINRIAARRRDQLATLESFLKKRAAQQA